MEAGKPAGNVDLAADSTAAVVGSAGAVVDTAVAGSAGSVLGTAVDTDLRGQGRRSSRAGRILPSERGSWST